MMNEQITLLALKASDPKTGWLDRQKFAELIVRECVDVIQKEVSFKYKDGGETEEFMGGHYAGSLLARVLIKKRFGVKE